MATAAKVYRNRTGGRAFGRPANGVESPYLLTGLGVCAVCGGSMAVLKRAHGPRGARRQVPFYDCMTRHLRGGTICSNTLAVPLDAADVAVLDAVEHDILQVEILETALYKAMAMLKASAQDDPIESLQAELAHVQAEGARLAQAIASGGDIPSLVAALQDRERRGSHLRAALVTAERQRKIRRDPSRDVAQALDVMRAALTDWQGLLRQETGPARRALRALLQGRLVFTPQERGGERFYTFEGTGTITPVIAGGAGLQKVWWPQRDSNPCFSLERAVSSPIMTRPYAVVANTRCH